MHADLKPENIVISSDGRVRVVDFGLAKLVGGTPNAMSGTPAYMAPERWRGAPPTGAIDIWSLGVTLYELICGRRPVSDHELPRLSFASRALAAAMREIVAADPGWALAYALLAIIEGQTTDAARATIAAARSFADPGRDPSGMQMLDVLDSLVRGEPEAAFGVAREVFRQNGADLVAGAPLWTSAFLSRRTEEAVAALEQLHARFPELLFGMDLAEVLRWEARDAEADRVIRDWVAAHPDNLVARVELVRLEAHVGRDDGAQARARAREVLAIHGDREDALPGLFEALLASDQLSGARAITYVTGPVMLPPRARARRLAQWVSRHSIARTRSSAASISACSAGVM